MVNSLTIFLTPAWNNQAITYEKFKQSGRETKGNKYDIQSSGANNACCIITAII